MNTTLSPGTLELSITLMEEHVDDLHGMVSDGEYYVQNYTEKFKGARSLKDEYADRLQRAETELLRRKQKLETAKKALEELKSEFHRVS